MESSPEFVNMWISVEKVLCTVTIFQIFKLITKLYINIFINIVYLTKAGMGILTTTCVGKFIDGIYPNLPKEL